jgi:hypothetical protein
MMRCRTSGVSSCAQEPGIGTLATMNRSSNDGSPVGLSRICAMGGKRRGCTH